MRFFLIVPSTKDCLDIVSPFRLIMCTFAENMVETLTNIRRNKILRLALPAIASNITVPLLGLIDTVIVGHLGDAQYIAAIAVGGTLFSMIYWCFSFLRMGTSAFVSQAWGGRRLDEAGMLLVRSLMVAMIFGGMLCLLQSVLLYLSLACIDASDTVEHLASIYFNILIWGAPAVLGLYSLMGWFIGMQNSRFPMYISIVQNIVNIVGSLILVYGVGLKVEGVALGTLLSQYFAFGMALWLWKKYYGRIKGMIKYTKVWNKSSLKSFFDVNKHIFFRTLCLILVTVYFTSSGASQGDDVLSANMLLMQFFVFFSHFMDGFAYAGEALTGKYIGARDFSGLRSTIRGLFAWGVSLALVFSALYVVTGELCLSILTNNEQVIDIAGKYLCWVFVIPLVGFSAFIWDGIFIGATRTGWMFYSMLMATGLFFVLRFTFVPWWGNHGLWLAFVSYLLLRGVSQAVIWKRWSRYGW